MRLPRFTTRQLMLVVALSVLPVLVVVEDYRRQSLAAYHAERERYWAQQASARSLEGKAAIAEGKRWKAERLIRSANHEAERARGHARMYRELRRRWWLFGR